MTQSHGLLDTHRTKAAMLVVMQIRTAYAAKRNFDAYLIIA
jgi:hypothetical protein